MDNKPETPSKDNPLLRALSRWEWEGGSLEPDSGNRAAHPAETSYSAVPRRGRGSMRKRPDEYPIRTLP
jgi:hypothetical protein